MKKNYYVRYYQTYDESQFFQQFLQAIASLGLRLICVTTHEYDRYDETVIQYTTIWEIDENADYLLLDEKINQVLKSKHYNNK